LQAGIRKHLREHTPGGVELWRSADGCGSFALRDVTVEPAGGRLRITGPASATAGISFFGLCWANVAWSGRAEIVTRPEIGADWQLRFRDLDTRLYDATGRQEGLVTRLWTVVKGWMEAELSTFTLDLGPPVGELTTLLRGFAGTAAAPPLAVALTTMHPIGLTIEPDAVTVVIGLDLPPAPPVPRAPEPALTPAQLKRWEARVDSWDGFVAFIVKDLAGENADPAVRADLLTILLDARRQVGTVLARGPAPGIDAVRSIFLDTWANLRDIVRGTAAQQKSEPARAFRYLIFLAAGDALTAVDAIAPVTGLDFSADGLRRLAKSLAPDFPGDPLEQPEAADPRLQQLFRFRDPDDPPRRPRRKPPGTSQHWFAPRLAHAAEVDEWRDLGARLDRWVPATDELGRYRATVDRLLWVAAERTLDPDLLEERFDELFHHLVKATAWQESCWRQFVRRGDGVVYLESATADVGLMQINVRIWRGFFNATKLRWNAAYNAGAGAEILQHMLVRYGSREARERIENAARASYAAYHGGPARYRAYRTAPASSRTGFVARAFWEKYQAVAAGVADDRVLCMSRRPTS
jgi:hypothetical protein